MKRLLSRRHPRMSMRIAGLILLLMLLAVPAVQSAPVARVFYEGSLDTSYNTMPGPSNGTNDMVYAVTLQNGKAIIGGKFTAYQGTTRNALARLNLDGSVDTAFNAGEGTGPTHYVSTIALQSDNKVIIGGAFPSYDGTPRNNIARLTAANGSLDTTFNPGTGVQGVVYGLAVQPDGKVLIGGDFEYFNETPRSYLARVDASGALDGLNTGAANAPNQRVHVVALQPKDGKILIGGYFDEVGTAANKADYRHVARLTTAGVLDPTFNPTVGGKSVGGQFDEVNALVVQPDGKILIGGNFETFQGTDWGGIARVNPDGVADPTFNPGGAGTGTVEAILLQPDGKILISGSFSRYNGVDRPRIARLNSDGTLDLTFDPGTGATGSEIVDYINGMARQADGRIVVAGDFAAYDGTARNNAARVNAFGRWLYLPSIRR